MAVASTSWNRPVNVRRSAPRTTAATASAAWHLIGDDEVPIAATRAVDVVIRRDDVTKNDIVGPGRSHP